MSADHPAEPRNPPSLDPNGGAASAVLAGSAMQTAGHTQAEPPLAAPPPIQPTQPQLSPTEPPARVTVDRATVRLAWVAVLALAGLVFSGLLWQRLGNIQETVARQSADTSVQAVEARTHSRQAQELSRETAARLALMEARVSEVALQRSQLDELMQSLSRSRDENLVVDIDSALRLAIQQAQLVGSVQPMLAALKAADQRVRRAAQPRLATLQRAIARDTDRVRSAAVTDTASLVVKLDELMRLIDELPVANAVATLGVQGSFKPLPTDTLTTWWHRGVQLVADEIRALVRVSRVDNPDAALLSPEQTFFLRENLKLRLLNARLAVLSRQLETARGDMLAASAALGKYFEANARKTVLATGLMKQIQGQMQTLELPRVDDTLSALEVAAAGR